MMHNTPKIDTLLQEKEEIIETTKELMSYIQEIDEQLRLLDSLLNDLQPPFSGKIRIEWYKARNRVNPVPVVWYYTKKATWIAKKVSTKNLVKRVKTSSEFNENAAKVKGLLDGALTLLDLRKKAQERFTSYKRLSRIVLSSGQPVVLQYREWLGHLRSTVPTKQFGQKSELNQEKN